MQPKKSTGLLVVTYNPPYLIILIQRVFYPSLRIKE